MDDQLEPTLRLRVVERVTSEPINPLDLTSPHRHVIVRTLQQAWRGTDGGEQWRDVPIEFESPSPPSAQ